MSQRLTFTVKPNLPPRLAPLATLAQDFWISWHFDAIRLFLVAGSDLWLNTPRRPHEASGTSGMKAAVNGSLLLSTLDGWWDEAFSPEIGWEVGAGESYADEEIQDEIEADAVFAELEQNVIPMFYDRGLDGLPRAWIAKMRRSMKQVGQRFSAQRIVAEYHRMFYASALAQARRLAGNGWRDAIDLARYLARLEQHWPGTAVERLASTSPPTLRVGDRLEVTADVRLGGLAAADVQVSLYHGTLSASEAGADIIAGGECAAMELVEQDGEIATYRTQVVCHTTGRLGATVRITPTHPALAHQFVPGLFRQG